MRKRAFAQSKHAVADAILKENYLLGLGVPGGCHWGLRGQLVAEGALWGWGQT